jgi:hypothetical protein
MKKEESNLVLTKTTTKRGTDFLAARRLLISFTLTPDETKYCLKTSLTVLFWLENSKSICIWLYYIAKSLAQSVSESEKRIATKIAELIALINFSQISYFPKNSVKLRDWSNYLFF